MRTKLHEKKINRRLFLKVIGWGSFFITLGISIAAGIRFLYPRVLFEKPSVFKIGFPEEFMIEEGSDKHELFHIYEKWKKEESVWIVREKQRLYAIHARCTHLGCTPNYFADEHAFKCPCHGSQFRGNGVNFAGPAPRPLDRFSIYIGDDGRICVDKGAVYRYKEFNVPGAYIDL